MTYKIIITDKAFADVESIKSLISKDDLSKAEQHASHIFDRIGQLKSSPYSGVKISNSSFDYAGAYYLICINYVVIYQVDEVANSVSILRVLSHFQDWKNIVNKDLINSSEVIIQDDDIQIVKMNTSMYYDVHRNSLDEDNRKFVPDEVFETIEEASQVVDYIIQSYDSEDGPFIYAIIRKIDNANIGYVQLIKIEEGWEIGYHIAKIFTGHGYATRAVTLFINYLKENIDLDLIYGVALATNKASRRVLQKCGFELIFEGTGIYQGRKRKIIKTIKKLR